MTHDNAYARWFDESSPEGEVLLTWWAELQGFEGTGLASLHRCDQGHKPGMPGQRAELCRAGSDAEAVFSRAYQRLRVALPTDFRDEKRLPLVARILAQVKSLPAPQNMSRSLPSTMGMSKEGSDSPLVSELRFKRLLRAEGREEMGALLLRLLPLVGRTVNPLMLARDIWSWNERTRQAWANDYYLALLGRP